jgi:hypothetical protein
LEWAQQTLEEVWNHRPWRFKQRVEDVAVSAGELQADLPADFDNISELGGIFFDATAELSEVQAQIIFRMAELNQLSSTPTQFAVVGHNPDTALPQVIFDCAGPFEVAIYYEAMCPLVADRPIAPTLVEGTAGSPDGTYTYRVIYVTRDENQSEPGDISDPITVAAKTIMVTLPTSGTYNVVQRKVYRTLDGGSEYFLVTTIEDDTTTTWEDTIADGSLTEEITGISPLLAIPNTYHFTVLLPGVIAKARKVTGDTRDWYGEYQRGLAYMVSREIQRRSITKRLPRAMPGRMW